MPPKKKANVKNTDKTVTEQKPIKVTKKISKPAQKVPIKKVTKKEEKPEPVSTQKGAKKNNTKTAKKPTAAQKQAEKNKTTKATESKSKEKSKAPTKSTQQTKSKATTPKSNVKSQPAKKNESQTKKEEKTTENTKKQQEKKPESKKKPEPKKKAEKKKPQKVVEQEKEITEFGEMNQRQKNKIMNIYESYQSFNASGRGQGYGLYGFRQIQVQNLKYLNQYIDDIYAADLLIPRETQAEIFLQQMENLALDEPPEQPHRNRFWRNNNQVQDKTIKGLSLNFKGFEQFNIEYGQQIIEQMKQDEKQYIECKSLSIVLSNMDINSENQEDFSQFINNFIDCILENYKALQKVSFIYGKSLFQNKDQKLNQKLEKTIVEQTVRLVGHLPQIIEFTFAYYDEDVAQQNENDEEGDDIENQQQQQNQEEQQSEDNISQQQQELEEELENQEEEQEQENQEEELEIEEVKKPKKIAKKREEKSNIDIDNEQNYFVKVDVIKELLKLNNILWLQNSNLCKLQIYLPHYKQVTVFQNQNQRNKDGFEVKIDAPQYIQLLSLALNDYGNQFVNTQNLTGNNFGFGHNNNNNNDFLVNFLGSYLFNFKNLTKSVDKEDLSYQKFTEFLKSLDFSQFKIQLPKNNSIEIFDNKTLFSIFKNSPVHKNMNQVQQRQMKHFESNLNFYIEGKNIEIKFETNQTQQHRGFYGYNYNNQQNKDKYVLEIYLNDPKMSQNDINIIKECFNTEEILKETKVINFYLMDNELDQYKNVFSNLGDILKKINTIYSVNFILNEQENPNVQTYFRHYYYNRRSNKKQEKLGLQKLGETLTVLLDKDISYIYDAFLQIPNLKNAQIKVYTKITETNLYTSIFKYEYSNTYQQIYYETEVLKNKCLIYIQKFTEKQRNTLENTQKVYDEYQNSSNKNLVYQLYEQQVNQQQEKNNYHNNQRNNNNGLLGHNINNQGSLFGNNNNNQGSLFGNNNDNGQEGDRLFGKDSILNIKKTKEQEKILEEKPSFDIQRNDYIIDCVISKDEQIFEQNINLNIKVNTKTKLDEKIEYEKILDNLLEGKVTIIFDIEDIAKLQFTQMQGYILNVLKGVQEHDRQQNTLILNIFSYLISKQSKQIYTFSFNFPRNFYSPKYLDKEFFRKYPETLQKIKNAYDLQIVAPNLKDYNEDLQQENLLYSEIFQPLILKNEKYVGKKEQNEEETEIQEKKEDKKEEKIETFQSSIQKVNEEHEFLNGIQSIIIKYEESSFILKDQKLTIEMKKSQNANSQLFAQLNQYQTIIDNIFKAENIDKFVPIKKFEVEFNLVEAEDIVRWFEIFNFKAFTPYLEELQICIAEFDAEHYKLLRKLFQDSDKLQSFNVKIVHKPQRDPTKRKVVKKVTKKTRHKVHEQTEVQEEEEIVDGEGDNKQSIDTIKEEFLKSEQEKSLKFLGNLVPIIQNSQDLRELSFEIKGVKQGEIYLALIKKIQEHTKNLPNLSFVSLSMEDQTVSHMLEITENFLKTFHQGQDKYFSIKFNILDIFYLQEDNELKLVFEASKKECRTEEFKKILELVFQKIQFDNFTVQNTSKNTELNPTSYKKQNLEKDGLENDLTTFTFNQKDQNVQVSEKEILAYFDIISKKSLNIQKLVIDAPISDSIGEYLSGLIESNVETLINIDIKLFNKSIVIPHPDDLKSLFTNLKSFIENEKNLNYEIKKKGVQSKFYKNIQCVFELNNSKSWRQTLYITTYNSENKSLSLKSSRNGYNDIKIEKQLIEQMFLILSAKANPKILTHIDVNNLGIFTQEQMEYVVKNKEDLQQLFLQINQNNLHGVDFQSESDIIKIIGDNIQDFKNMQNFSFIFPGHQFNLQYSQPIIDIIHKSYINKIKNLKVHRLTANNQHQFGWGGLGQNLNERIDALKLISQNLEKIEDLNINAQYDLQI